VSVRCRGIVYLAGSGNATEDTGKTIPNEKELLKSDTSKPEYSADSGNGTEDACKTIPNYKQLHKSYTSRRAKLSTSEVIAVILDTGLIVINSPLSI
jgi:hypothetical protein